MPESVLPVDRLRQILNDIGPLAVAVSGGVDSMTLAAVAHDVLGDDARMVHAVSAAVPPQATERVLEAAQRDAWQLLVMDAGEFSDARYLANPADRCFFCKSHLYAGMSQRCDRTLVSGTNKDDLTDYRPGLRAADAHGVRHPYVEAGVDKAAVRAIARDLGLGELAELPAAPCLSSRIETGIAIDPRTLPVVNDVERLVAGRLAPDTVRCRVRRSGVVIELDEKTLAALDGEGRRALLEDVAARFAVLGEMRPVSLAPYRMGSAFLRPGPG